jgi:hypothetical protein
MSPRFPIFLTKKAVSRRTSVDHTGGETIPRAGAAGGVKLVKLLGGEYLDLSLPCRHDPAKVRMLQFSQQEFFKSVDGIDLNQ